MREIYTNNYREVILPIYDDEKADEVVGEALGAIPVIDDNMIEHKGIMTWVNLVSSVAEELGVNRDYVEYCMLEEEDIGDEIVSKVIEETKKRYEKVKLTPNYSEGPVRSKVVWMRKDG